MDYFFAMQLNQSCGNSFDDLFEWIVGNFTNKIRQTPIRTVLQNYDEILFFAKKKELLSFQDVGMAQRHIQFGLIFSIIFILFVHRDDLECVRAFVNGLDSINLTETTLSKFLEYRIVMNFLRHHMRLKIQKI